MEQMQQKGFAPEALLSSYDAIFVPGWVIEEAACSTYRSQYLNKLHTSGLPLYRIDEKSYIDFTDGDEIQMLRIVRASVSELSELIRYVKRNIQPEDILDLEEYTTWITQMYEQWPILGAKMANGQPKRKNAGEISLTVLAEVLAWNQPNVSELTIYTQDADTRKFQTSARLNLEKVLEGSPSVTVTYKSNDFIMCQMLREGTLEVEDIKQLRKDSRRVCYTQKRPDESVALEEKVLDNDAFIALISDPSVQILF